MGIQSISASANTVKHEAVGQARTSEQTASKKKPGDHGKRPRLKRHVGTSLEHVTSRVKVTAEAALLAIALPPGRKSLTRRELAYKIAERVFERNNIPVSRAALEEVAADLMNLERMDINGERRGNWTDPQMIPQQNGKAVNGYWFSLSADFQNHILTTYQDKTLQITAAHTPALAGAGMRERMTRAIALSYGLYLTPALKAALGENATPEKIALLVGGAGVIGIAAKTPARSALGVVGGGLALHQGLKNYLEFDDFLKACAEAKSQADLDLAARQFAKFAARLGVDGLAAFVGGAVAKIAPKALHEADQVMIEATQTIKQRMRETSGWTAEATTAEGIGIARLPVKEDRVIRTQQEMTSVDSGGQASGLRFRIVFQKHVVERDLSVPRKNGIGGAHSLQEFNKCLHEIKVVSRRPHLTVNGVENIKYKIPTLDKTGRPDGGWSARTYEKTVYDSKVISDDRMMAWGRQAYAEAQAAGRFVAPRQWVGTAPNGIAFRGFVDDAGAVVTFFPDM